GIDEYIEQVGEENARKLWNMSLEALDIIDERVKTYNIQCDWKKGYATLALNHRRMDDLIAIEKESRERFGYQHMQLWDRAKLEQHLGSKIYCGALYDSQSGHLHPLNYCLGLAAACLEQGVTIYEHTPALDLQFSGKQVKVITPQGTITADNV
ncbi:FAD-binding oxidoreductase, partial [Glaesserella parasuis]|nr:FAD-binding oxidoreductase [Glaesserella parasuis]